MDSANSPLDYHPSSSFLPKYLERIGFTGEVNNSLESICALMQQQLATIPFENTEVQNGYIVSLEPDVFIDKIITQKRGGYCYELNGLFALVLQTLAVEYQLVACRPMFYPVKRPKTHMALVATIGGEQYLLDLGFGSHGIRAPINLKNTHTKISQCGEQFFLSQQDNNFLLEAIINNERLPQYSFNLNRYEFIDFAPANYMNSTHPETLFVKQLIALIFTPTGKKVMLGNRLRITQEGCVTESTVNDINSALTEHFQLPPNSLTAQLAS